MNEAYLKYWGKAGYGADAMKIHLLPYHCLDVAAVGQVFLNRNMRLRTNLARLCGFGEHDFTTCMVFFLALHDIGKFAEGFQNLRPDLLDILQNKESQRGYIRHDTLGYLLWRDRIRDHFDTRQFSPKNAKKGSRRRESGYDYWMRAIAGHHGKPPEEPLSVLSDYFSDEDIAISMDYVDCVIGLIFGTDATLPDVNRRHLQKASWWLGGFAVLCDWIGSNMEFFAARDTNMPLDEYWKLSLESAERAVDLTELLVDVPIEEQRLQDLFAPDITTPTPLQALCSAFEIGDGPSLYILEDVTGAGKTEAAVLLAHRLMVQQKGAGLYVALPTMATANAMFARMAGDDQKQPVYQRLFTSGTQPSLVLAHSARNLSQDFRQAVIPLSTETEGDYGDDAIPAGVHCNIWLADSLKKALLAAVGVGTIDQALLSILPSRHQCLRLFGLMDKVLVVDEVHACDAYMQTLLKALLRAQASVGSSVILLSATLSYDQRQALVTAFLEGAGKEPLSLEKNSDEDYPLLTCYTGGELREANVETREEVKRTVKVEFLHQVPDVVSVVNQAVNEGRCVCWIRNTVSEARQGYELLRQKYPDWSIDLFHARFALSDRLAIENRVLDRFGKYSTSVQRKGQVLVATQVVEQSLDVDFDVMVTDLAPVDLIIQRAGRLCRHVREGHRTPVLYVLSPKPVENPKEDWLGALFPQLQYVYPNHGQLWLTARLLNTKKKIQVPEDIRVLTEGVFGSESLDLIPEGLLERTWDAEGQDLASVSVANLNELKLREGYSASSSNRWWDEAMTPTRLGEPTTTVYLAKWHNGDLVPWNDGYMAWQQSAVQIRTYHIAQEAPVDISLQAVMETTKETLPSKGKWGVLLPLTLDKNETWHGKAINEKGELVTIYYNRELGLVRENELSTLHEGVSHESA